MVYPHQQGNKWRFEKEMIFSLTYNSIRLHILERILISTLILENSLPIVYQGSYKC